MQLIDRVLPVSAVNVVIRKMITQPNLLVRLIVVPESFKILAQGVLLFRTEKLMTATVPFCLMVIFILQRVYLQTSRQLRILDLEPKSPVYSHLLETVSFLFPKI